MANAGFEGLDVLVCAAADHRGGQEAEPPLDLVHLREASRGEVHALIAVGVNAAGHREVLDLNVATADDGSSWRPSCAR
ncbi:transposase [Actinacidiphila glaucinigra]